MIRTFILILASISFIVVMGGATYEHASVVPIWAAAPPASLAMFQGEYALAASNFWIPIHPVTMIFLLAALAANWSTPRRMFILITLGGYMVVLLTTFVFFVPELISITQSAYSATINPELARRAKNWEIMSLVRLAVIFLLAVNLLYGLSKPVDSNLQ
ncbi:MAG: hypothetical protein ACJ72Z_08985 [Pyrinomonadaceae bacterium]